MKTRLLLPITLALLAARASTPPWLTFAHARGSATEEELHQAERLPSPRGEPGDEEEAKHVRECLRRTKTNATLKAAPATIYEGETSTLTWSVRFPSDCADVAAGQITLSGKPKSPSGSITVKPTQTGAYVLAISLTPGKTSPLATARVTVKLRPITWQWNSLQGFSSDVYKQAMSQNQGIVGMDRVFPTYAGFVGSELSVEKVGWPPGNRRTTHRAILQNRLAHTGLLVDFTRANGGFIDDDDDVLMYIRPNPGDVPYEDYLSTGRTKAKDVEGEIDVTPGEGPLARRRAKEVVDNGPRVFTQFTGYGPFVHEKHNYWDTNTHDYLEIHPCENLWWSELAGGKLTYTLGVFSDSSGRFNKWRRSPVIALNAIAFDFEPGSKPLNYTMEVLAWEGMVPYPLFDDHATEHTLMDGATTIAKISEPSRTGTFFSIDFARISKTQTQNGYRYRGLLKIHSAVMDTGYSLFRVKENTGGISIGPSPTQITVTLRSIHCKNADDKGGVEEIYGAYGVSAVTGMSPFHANVMAPGATTGTLWRRTSSNTLNLKKGEVSNVNAALTFTLPLSGELVLSGDLKEEDEREGGDNDNLGEHYVQRISVKDLQSGVPQRVTHSFKSGNSEIEVQLAIDRKDGLVVAPIEGVAR